MQTKCVMCQPMNPKKKPSSTQMKTTRKCSLNWLMMTTNRVNSAVNTKDRIHNNLRVRRNINAVSSLLIRVIITKPSKVLMIKGINTTKKSIIKNHNRILDILSTSRTPISNINALINFLLVKSKSMVMIIAKMKVNLKTKFRPAVKIFRNSNIIPRIAINCCTQIKKTMQSTQINSLVNKGIPSIWQQIFNRTKEDILWIKTVKMIKSTISLVGIII